MSHNIQTRQTTKKSAIGSLDSFTCASPKQRESDSATHKWHWIEKNLSKQNQYITDRFNEICEQLSKSEKRIIERVEQSLKRVEESFEEFKIELSDVKRDLNEVKERVVELETVAGDVISLRKEIDYLKKVVDKQENATVASDIRINGVPMYENENINGIFNTLCDTIGINRLPVKSIFRLKKTKTGGTNLTDPAIIVRFDTPFERNFLLKAISNFLRIRKGQLLLSDVGFDSNQPFNVKENLTQRNFLLYIEAVRLWRDNKLESVYSRRGIVYVKVNRADEPSRIDSFDDIKKLNLFRMQRGNNNIPIGSG